MPATGSADGSNAIEVLLAPVTRGTRKREQTLASTVRMYTSPDILNSIVQVTDEGFDSKAEPGLATDADLVTLNAERAHWTRSSDADMPSFNQLVKTNKLTRHYPEVLGDFLRLSHFPLQHLSRMIA